MSSPQPARPGGRGRDPRRALGARGEDAACGHLERLGFAIVARNVRSRHGEIDMIAFDTRVLAFVEVKTLRMHARATNTAVRDARTASGLGETGATAGYRQDAAMCPLAGLRWPQRHRLRLLATLWLADAGAGLHAEEIRFDAIGVLFDREDRLARLEHIEGAW